MKAGKLKVNCTQCGREIEAPTHLAEKEDFIIYCAICGLDKVKKTIAEIYGDNHEDRTGGEADQIKTARGEPRQAGA